MRKTAILLVFIFLITGTLHAQVDTVWTKTYGGSVGDFGYYGEPTSDGGFIVVGETSSFGAGGSDVYLIKTDPDGDSLWIKTFGDTFDERGNCVIQTENKGFIIAGYVSYGYDSSKTYLIKTDSLGNLLWEKLYYPSGFKDYAYFVQETSDKGFIITGISFPGYTYQDAFLIKIDSAGNALWSQTYGSDYGDHGYCVRETADGGYIVTGTYNCGLFGEGGDIYLFKTDRNGNLLWEKTFGGGMTDIGFCVLQNPDKGYIITGETASYGDPDGDVYLMKTDSLGNQEWTPKYFGGTDWDRGRYVEQTPEGGYIIVGRTRSWEPNGDIYTLKTDSLGILLWQRRFGGGGIEFGSSIQRTSDGAYFITGTTTSFGAGSWEVYIIKTTPDVGVEDNVSIRNNRLKISVPTFLKDEIKVMFTHSLSSLFQVVLYDMSGRPVFKKTFPSSSSTLHLVSEKIKRLPAGIYIFKISLDGKILYQIKILKPLS